MSVSNISGRASMLVSGLLVAGLLLWQFQLPERSSTAKPAKQSQNLPPPQKPVKFAAVAAVALPPPPPPAKRQEAPVKAKKAVMIQKLQTQKKIKSIENLKKPSMKPVAIRAIQKTVQKKVPARTVRVSTTDYSSKAKEGRTLLRLLEYGSGPIIEIAWPDRGSARSSLYELLRGCYGMKTALMDTDGGLYLSRESRNWRPDMDRYSGLIRRPSGFLAPGENEEARAVRRRHRLGSDSAVVRLFPRRVDAALLGGLQSLLGSRYQNAKVIQAFYRQDGSRLFVDSIAADGVTVLGRIAFSPAQTGCG